MLHLLFVITTNAQNTPAIKCKDTLTVFFNKYENFQKKIEKEYNSGYYLNDTIYYTSNKRAMKNGMTMSEALKKSVFYNCSNQTKFKYSQFYTKGGKMIAEGTWNIEGFQGQYKEYHKSGKLKMDGFKNGDLKIKNWKYFDEAGKLVKQEEYDQEGNLR